MTTFLASALTYLVLPSFSWQYVAMTRRERVMHAWSAPEEDEIKCVHVVAARGGKPGRGRRPRLQQFGCG